MQPDIDQHYTLPLQGLDTLIQALGKRGYQVIAPVVRDNVILYDEIDSSADLPVGWTDEQSAGNYRLTPRSDKALFGYNVGPHSWKKFLHPERLRLWQAQRNANTVTLVEESEQSPRYAFLGARGCELSAIAIQDKVFLDSGYRDSDYANRRADSVIIAVNCTQAGNTCFCTSMNTGPEVRSGFDLALTEIVHSTEHRFLVQIGSELGIELVDELNLRTAAQEDSQLATKLSNQARDSMGREMNTEGIKELLQRNLENPRWEQVASRCLSCANCTMVCPTCFCSTTEDVTDLSGEHAERWRRWDSCFTADFSYLPEGSVRSSTGARYRQWMTHKLANWFDQFGTSGCVGCGRCVTWCPVGIDITEEVAAIQASEVGKKTS